MSVWLVVGSAPGVETYYAALRPLLPRVQSITCNAGGKLYLPPDRPDYYWLSDPKAVPAFASVGQALQARGTRIISARMPDRRSPLHADLVVDLPHRGGHFQAFRPKTWIHPRLSGLLCVEYALLAGAGAVAMIGFRGYSSTWLDRKVDEFDGRLGPPGGSQYNKNWIAPFLQSCVDALPGVRFIMGGRPLYPLMGGNVITTHSEAQTASAVEAAMH